MENEYCVYPASSYEKFDIICDEVISMYPKYERKFYFEDFGDTMIKEFNLGKSYIKVIDDCFVDSIRIETNLNISRKQLAKFDEATGFKRVNRNIE